MVKYELRTILIAYQIALHNGLSRMVKENQNELVLKVNMFQRSSSIMCSHRNAIL